MRSGILVFVYRFDRLLGKRDSSAFHFEQHVGLVFEAFPFYPAKIRQIAHRYCSETCLCIRKPDTIQAEHSGSRFIPGSTSCRDAGKIKVPAAKNDFGLFPQHTVSAGNNILCQMLAVAIDSDYAISIREAPQHCFKCRFQSSAFSSVYTMMDNNTFRKGFRPVKMYLLLPGAAVIHDHNMPKPALQEAVHNFVKLMVRIQRRENDHTGFPAVFYTVHISLTLCSE